MFVSRKVLQDFQISVLSRYQLSVSLITDLSVSWSDDPSDRLDESGVTSVCQIQSLFREDYGEVYTISVSTRQERTDFFHDLILNQAAEAPPSKKPTCV